MPESTHRTEACLGIPFVLKSKEQWEHWKHVLRNKVFGPWRLDEERQYDPEEYPCLAVPLCHGQESGAILEFEFIYKDVVEDMFEEEKS